MIKVLIQNPLLLLFLVAAIGYPLGRVRFRGISLGVSAILFVGLAMGSLHPDLKLPEIIYVLGLVLFVYTVGLSSGADFLSSFRREGMRYNLLAVAALLLATALSIAAHQIHGLKTTLAVGMFTGSLTNTPALAAALETIKAYAPKQLLDQLLSEPVVAYSITYPMGVIGTILAIAIMQKIWKVDYAAEAKQLSKFRVTNQTIQNITIRVTHPEATEGSLEELRSGRLWEVVFGRGRRGEHVFLTNADTRLSEGDLIVVVGAPEELERVKEFLGEESREHLEEDRSEFYFRRIFVSNPQIAGRRLSELNIEKELGAVVTRIRRGDVDLLPHPDMVLLLGDRVRVLSHRGRMAAVTKFFGDSYRSVSEVDFLTFSLGLAMGLLLGIIPIPMPGGLSIKLGFAGGPLVVALILGALERTGPMVWNLPYSANVTLRQIGLTLFLAGIGTRAGYGFVSTFTSSGGVTIFATGAIITCMTVLATLWAGHVLMKIPMSILTGMVAGVQTQPAVLGFSLEQTRNDLPNIGYTAVYPVATITKILCAQIILSILPIAS